MQEFSEEHPLFIKVDQEYRKMVSDEHWGTLPPQSPAQKHGHRPNVPRRHRQGTQSRKRAGT
jgi:hypothetical protein